VNRRVRILLVLLVLCLGFAGWQWLRPYEWNADPGARAEVRFTRLERDGPFFWLDVYLRITDPRGHDLEKPMRLVLADGRRLPPADTTLEGSAEQPIEAISLRFWLDEKQLNGPLTLRMNDGTLTIRKRTGIPDLASQASRFHHTTQW
jgi:hypothetical protein